MTEAELDELIDTSLASGRHPEHRVALEHPPQCAQCGHARHIAACALLSAARAGCECPGTPLLPPLPKAYR